LSIGFNNITRVEAIDGETLVWGDELKKYFVLHEDSYKWIPHSNNAGIFGCALSHVKLWEKLAECSDETVWMIVEDDMVPNNNFGKDWTGIYNSIKDNKNWDICYLGYIFFPKTPRASIGNKNHKNRTVFSLKNFRLIMNEKTTSKTSGIVKYVKYQSHKPLELLRKVVTLSNG
jgi:GR25 family glycosyltransferase involved in LPS biosynthesis